MGIASLPAPSEGVLTLLVVNTAISVSILKEILRSLLSFLRIRAPLPAGADDDDDDGAGAAAASHAVRRRADPTLADRFRARFKPVRFGRRRAAVDCRVCLSRFEPDSVVDRLSCGHLFHRACLETWLDYHHATCPLCRSHLLPPPPPPPPTPPPPLLAPGSRPYLPRLPLSIGFFFFPPPFLGCLLCIWSVVLGHFV
uniref:RING-type domain-containing protein n=1 Tax=Ananas comosus var. bracteatus TaxID=296719 RepID=A0A6V7QVV3_ANACO